jgi:hypothetical protein
MKILSLIALFGIILALKMCDQNTTKVSPCIRLPDKTTSREKDMSAKLSADLLAQVGKPSLEAAYKSKLNDAYAELSQKSLEQLVLIEFLVCLKTEHKNDISPETLESMDKALQRAINKAAGAQSLSGGVSAQSKEALTQTAYGQEKVKALSDLGH